MTWWYRWLCRLSGVLGAVCEYRPGEGARPAARRACAPAPPRPAPSTRPRRKGSESGRGQRGTRGAGQWQGPPERGPWRLLWLPAGARGSWASGLGSRLWGRELRRGAPGAAPPRLGARGQRGAGSRTFRGCPRAVCQGPVSPAGRRPRLCTGAGGAATFGRTLFVSGRAQVWPDFLGARCWPGARQVVPQRRPGGDLREVAAPQGPHCALGGRCGPCAGSSASATFHLPSSPSRSVTRLPQGSRGVGLF